MHPASLSISDYQYNLPEENIAKFPLEERDQSRLLVYKNKQINEYLYSQLADQLPENALLVFNNTKVVEARILFHKPTGGVIEIFLLEPDERHRDISVAMKQQGAVYWKCLIGGASKWKHGQVLRKEMQVDGKTFILEVKIADRLPGSFLIEFNWQPAELSFAEMLHQAGLIPIPPYLKRETTATDTERYQTIYAKTEGSVAAPTAGLHFTENLLASLKRKNIETSFLTLHVGAGTFMPVKAQQMKDHEMHAEFLEVDKTFIEKLPGKEGVIFPVGTTSLRTIESLYWMGYKCRMNPSIQPEALVIQQWDVYDYLPEEDISIKDAFEALGNWMEKNKMDKLVMRTRILIAPGYRFKITSGLITNFHQPQSTLLLLVAALIGDNWKTVYDYALRRNFRFLSYGDGCLLYPV